MAPLLLDQSRLIKTGLYLCMLIAVVFIGGYCSGYSKGYDHAESRITKRTLPPVLLALPEPAYTSSSEFEPRPPDVIAPGADIDVDAPDTGPVRGSGPAFTDAEQSTGRTEIKDAAHAPQPAGPVLQVASLAVTPDVIAGATDASPLDSNADIGEASYSVQTGMFGNIRNAEVRLEALSMSGLDAYIDEYINAGNETRFNVRFGFYRDRASAKAALRAYRAGFAGEGYIVRVDN